MKHSNQSLLLISALLLGAACQPTVPTETVSIPSVEPSSLPTASPLPTSAPTPDLTPAPSLSPPVPTPTPTPVPTPTATPTPLPTATPVPTPVPTPTATPVPLVRLEVNVRDDNSDKVNNAKVTVLSSDPKVSFSGTAKLDNGVYVLEDVPANISLEVEATAPGYTTRTLFASGVFGEKIVVLNFKDDHAISDRPEVVLTKPGRSSTWDLDGVIELTFSENMDKDSVERSFALQLDSLDDGKFIVGTPITRSLSLVGRESDSVMDIKHFDVEWDTDRVLRLTPRFYLPIANKSSFKVILNYIDSDGKGGGIKDSSGTKGLPPVRSTISNEDGTELVEDGVFLSGFKHKPFLPFNVSSSLPSPVTLQSVGSEVGEADNVVMTFSSALKFDITNGGVVVGGADGSTGNAPAEHAKVTANQAAQNYLLTCNSVNVPIPASGKAIFLAPNKVKLFVASTDSLFNTGDNCTINVGGILDTTGQAIGSSTRSFRAP